MATLSCHSQRERGRTAPLQVRPLPETPGRLQLPRLSVSLLVVTAGCLSLISFPKSNVNQVCIAHAGHERLSCFAMCRKGESDRSPVPLNHFFLGGGLLNTGFLIAAYVQSPCARGMGPWRNLCSPGLPPLPRRVVSWVSQPSSSLSKVHLLHTAQL